MKRICFNRNWEFTLGSRIDEFNTLGIDKYSDAAGAAARFLDHSNWEKVDLPHDWTLTLGRNKDANTFAGAYPNTHYHRYAAERHSNVESADNIGWYRKQFGYDPAWAGKRVFIEFEGVFRDAIVWCNGVYLDRHASGYTDFAIELTDHLVPGADNSIAVRADSEHPEGWWYEGAGIYRNVHLLIGESVYVKRGQTIVRTAQDGTVNASATLVNDTAEAHSRRVTWRILDAEGKEAAHTESAAQFAPYGETAVQAQLKIAGPHLWSVDTPYLYTLEIRCGEEIERVSFGVRSVAFDADRGFLLNGAPLKLRGANIHQDFGGVGVALTDNLHAYRILRLKEMGVNAIRAHHALPASLLDICDRLGMLVMAETRLFGTSPEAVRQLTDIIESDRNHPCVFIWCMGNEEFSIQNDAWSFRLMEKMTRIVKALDPTRPVTYAGCNGPDFTGANGAAEVRGVNYIRNDSDGYWLDQYHRDHPHQPVIGTEESSYALSRGGAENDLGSGLLDALGNVTMPWGSTPKGWVKYYEERSYLSGGFMWTGFDYRGEPNPFYYANIASCFGTIDLCGMEKPPFYYYKAWWTDKPVLKLAPHWNHKPGDTVTVAAFTNCERLTLSLNGRIIETREVSRFDAPQFTLPFEPGVLSVEGVRGGLILRDELITSGKTAQVRIVPILAAQGEADVAIYQLEAYDADGVFCPLASQEIGLSIENGRIIGVGNGDPACWDAEQVPPTEQTLPVRSFSCEEGVFNVPAKAPNALRMRFDWLETESGESIPTGFEDDFRIVARFGHNLTPTRRRVYTARISHTGAYEYVEFERLGSRTEVYLNGEKIGDTFRIHGRQANNAIRPYRFYARFAPGENELTVVALQEQSDPPAMSGHVRLGRRIEGDWKVRLHYGKARVFVRSETPEDVVLRAKELRG